MYSPPWPYVLPPSCSFGLKYFIVPANRNLQSILKHVLRAFRHLLRRRPPERPPFALVPIPLFLPLNHLRSVNNLNNYLIFPISLFPNLYAALESARFLLMYIRFGARCVGRECAGTPGLANHRI